MSKIEKSSDLRAREAILADIVALGPAVRGSVTQKRRVLADGSERIYHQLQCWSKGKNCTLHIPDELVDEFKAAVDQSKSLDRLVTELSDSDTQTIFTTGAAKKKRKR